MNGFRGKVTLNIFNFLGLPTVIVRVWFLVIAWFADLERSAWYRTAWELRLVFAVPLVWLFSTFIFGQVEFKYGGGAFTSARIHLGKDAPQDIFGGVAPTVYLIDETEGGFYVVRDNRTSLSIFISRAMVTGIEFSIVPTIPGPYPSPFTKVLLYSTTDSKEH